MHRVVGAARHRIPVGVTLGRDGVPDLLLGPEVVVAVVAKAKQQGG